MASRLTARDSVFLDTNFAVALASKRDQYNSIATSLAAEVKSQQVKLVTTIPVVIEICNMLSSLSLKKHAFVLLQSVQQDPQSQVEPLSDTLYRQGLQLYFQHQDKTWGLTDCISFVVMQEHGITQALTADHHFEQAGFVTFMRQAA